MLDYINETKATLLDVFNKRNEAYNELRMSIQLM